MKGSRTTVDIYLDDKRYLDNIKWNIREKLGRNIRYLDLMDLIIEFIKSKEDEFFEFVKKKLGES